MNLRKLRLEDIKIAKRIRSDLGDIDQLAISMKDHGLLCPIGISEDGKLIHGERRFAAAKKLGWLEIDALTIKTIDDLLEHFGAQGNQNVCRLDFSPSEAVAIEERIEPFYEAYAVQQFVAGNYDPKRNWYKQIVAVAVGLSAASYLKAKAVVKSGHRDLVNQMDTTRNIDLAHKDFFRRKRAKENQKAIAAISETVLKFHCRLEHCSMEELLGSIDTPDAIITQPPYDASYETLAEFAKDVPIVAIICHQRFLAEILTTMSKHLEYTWTVAVQNKEPQHDTERCVSSLWTPILLFGTIFYSIKDFIDDSSHEVHPKLSGIKNGVSALIEGLTLPGQLVCDPFLGDGNTAFTSIKLRRRFVGCDRDQGCVETTWNRLMRWQRETQQFEILNEGRELSCEARIVAGQRDIQIIPAACK